MVNRLNSLALEVNSLKTGYANRLFASYSGFRDHRTPFSAPFPTIEIGEGSVTYTTAGHEPFSIHNILDQNVWQLTDNLTFFRGNHVFTLGANFERFSFFNSFNIFRNGVFFLPPSTASERRSPRSRSSSASPIRRIRIASTSPSWWERDRTRVRTSASARFRCTPRTSSSWTSRFTLTAGLRADVPKYLTDPWTIPSPAG
jgi:hypothetical protein